jgi:hypothetical protein
MIREGIRKMTVILEREMKRWVSLEKRIKENEFDSRREKEIRSAPKEKRGEKRER